MPEASQAPASAPTSADNPSEAGQLDHLAHLHRMSRTAGLGSSDYAAVNTAAVAAIVLGLLSALSLATPIFLVLPVAGLVVSIIAIKQITSSHGTQTGMVLAILGLAACVGFAGFTGYQKVASDRRQAQDVNEIDGLVVQFGQDVVDKKFDDVLKISDPRFSEQVSAKRMETFFDQVTSAFGQVKSFTPTHLYDIQEDPETHYRIAVGMMAVEAEKTSAERPLKTEIRFRNSGDGWKIYAMPEWFAPPQAGAKGAAAAPTGPAGPPAP